MFSDRPSVPPSVIYVVVLCFAISPVSVDGFEQNLIRAGDQVKESCPEKSTTETSILTTVATEVIASMPVIEPCTPPKNTVIRQLFKDDIVTTDSSSDLPMRALTPVDDTPLAGAESGEQQHFESISLSATDDISPMSEEVVKPDMIGATHQSSVSDTSKHSQINNSALSDEVTTKESHDSTSTSVTSRAVELTR